MLQLLARFVKRCTRDALRKVAEVDRRLQQLFVFPTTSDHLSDLDFAKQCDFDRDDE